MNRSYSNLANPDVRRLLNIIADKSTSPETYGWAMIHLGEHLGAAMLPAMREVPSCSAVDTTVAAISPTGKQYNKVYLVATVEDADFLAFGVLQHLESQFDAVGFACFWNERTSLFNRKELAVAPVLKQYREPADQVDTLIIVKSIISGGCVVRTNLQNLIQKMQPQNIFIAAPVMYQRAEGALRAAFKPEITDKFKFFYFAKDNERTDAGEVIPGIGGMVYDRLGFNGQADKNRYVPEIVKQRRQDIIKRRKASV